MSSNLSPISAIAWSQEIRVHLPSTIFVGYLSRRSPCACSRTEAPLAQWEPKLIGLSNPGSWRVHTPFCTVAITVQPTEQWVHTVLTDLVSPAGAAGAASALVVMPPFVASTAPSPPAAIPERRRKLRRSRNGLSPLGASLLSPVPRVVPFDFLISMVLPRPNSELRGVVVFPDVRRLTVAGALRLLFGLRFRRLAARYRGRGAGEAAQPDELQEIAPLRLFPLGPIRHHTLQPQASIAKAALSISTKRRPSIPTAA